MCNAVKLTILYPKPDRKVCFQCKTIHHFIAIDQRQQVTAIQVHTPSIRGSKSEQSRSDGAIQVRGSNQREQVRAIQVMQSLHLLLVLGSLVLFPAHSQPIANNDQDTRPPGQFANHPVAKREAGHCLTGCCKSCVRSQQDCYDYTHPLEKKPWGPCGIDKFCSWIRDKFCNDNSHE